MSVLTQSAAVGRRLCRGVLGILLSIVLMLGLVVPPAVAASADAYEPDDLPANAPILGIDEAPLVRALDPQGEVDWCGIDVEAGKSYSFECIPTSSDPWFDAVLEVYTYDRTAIIASDDDSGMNLMPKLVVEAVDSGRLWVRVTARSAWATGDYAIQVRTSRVARLSGTATGVCDLGLPGAQIKVYAEDTTGWSEAARTTADSAGRFSLPLEPGTYRLGYAAAGGTSTEQFWPGVTELGLAEDLELAPDAELDVGTLSAVSWARVAGTLTSSEPGVPVADVCIAAYRLVGDTWQPFAWTVSDTSGTWTMPLAFGTYKFAYSEQSGALGTVYHPAAANISTADEIVVGAETPELTADLSCPSDTVTDVTTVALAGADRYDTAVRVSRQAFPEGAKTAIVVTGTSWPDGLGAASLAGALDAPILLVKGDSVPASVLAELKRLGTEDVVIVGGTGAVGPRSEATLAAVAGVASVRRIGGTDRYETARLVAENTLAVAGNAWDGTFVLASGSAFPDVLAASPVAAAQAWPVLLTKPTELSSATARFISEHPGCTPLVVGGPGAVREGVIREVNDLSGSTATRLSGADRYSTALEIAAYALKRGLLGTSHLAVATGQDFPDALTCSILQARNHSLLLLTPSTALDAEVAAMLQSLPQGMCEEIVFVGGGAAISADVREQVVATLGH